jgi:hypothetical protein
LISSDLDFLPTLSFVVVFQKQYNQIILHSHEISLQRLLLCYATQDILPFLLLTLSSPILHAQQIILFIGAYNIGKSFPGIYYRHLPTQSKNRITDRYKQQGPHQRTILPDF